MSSLQKADDRPFQMTIESVSGVPHQLADGTRVTIFRDPEQGPALARNRSGKWFHLSEDETRPFYKRTFDWIDWFREDRASVESVTMKWHIKPDGTDAYEGYFSEVHRFSGGTANVFTGSGAFGSWSAIDPDGKLIAAE